MLLRFTFTNLLGKLPQPTPRFSLLGSREQGPLEKSAHIRLVGWQKAVFWGHFFVKENFNVTSYNFRKSCCHIYNLFFGL